MFEEHRLPPGARLIHVGPPKTGTTAIQSAFVRVRDELPELGVHYAGRGSRPRAAAAALTGVGVSARQRPSMAAWEALVQEVRDAGPLRVCISNEQFAAADDDAANRLVNDLGGNDAHVVMVVRPLDALLPSQWQQRVRKRRNMIDYDAWLRLVLADRPDDEHHRHFWRMHDLAAQIDRWTTASPERVLTVVSDEVDRGFLPRLFEGMLDLPEGLLVPAENRANRSLDMTGAELLRALDQTAQEHDWEPEVYLEDLKPRISKYLRGRPSDGINPIALPEWALDRVSELNATRVRVLESTSVRVIGDPGTLTTRAMPTSPVTGEHRHAMISVAVAAEVAGVGIDRLLERQKELEQEAAEVAVQVQRRGGARVTPAWRRRWSPGAGGVGPSEPWASGGSARCDRQPERRGARATSERVAECLDVAREDLTHLPAGLVVVVVAVVTVAAHVAPGRLGDRLESQLSRTTLKSRSKCSVRPMKSAGVPSRRLRVTICGRPTFGTFSVPSRTNRSKSSRNSPSGSQARG